MPGFTFNDVYTMPVHLKNFYLREFMKFKKTEQEKINKTQLKKQPTIPRRLSPK
jgi:hypothetical protein|tara:strand:- start:51 stop:212 length:162 start_codon:yes stop_codon:yes gene_type:complete